MIEGRVAGIRFRTVALACASLTVLAALLTFIGWISPALAPEEFFDRVLADIRKYSQSETFADDVCVVGMQIRHTE